MGRHLVVLTGLEAGQGKTLVVQDVVGALGGAGIRVGGFSVRRAYAGSDTPLAFYAHLYNGGRVVRLSHARLKADEEVDLEMTRVVHGELGHQNVTDAKTREVLDATAADLADPAIEAVVIDEIGPALVHTTKRKDRRAEALPSLVESALASPKWLVLVVASSRKLQQVDARKTLEALEDGSDRFERQVHRFALNPGNLPLMPDLILQAIGLPDQR